MMRICQVEVLSLLLLGLVLAGCATSVKSSNSAGQGAIYVDPASSNSNSGVGVESQDIVAISDKMVRDLLATGRIANAASPPRIIIDDTRFINESNQTLNLNLLLDRLRIELIRAANGRILFVSRENVDLVQKEKELKGVGNVDEGTLVPNQSIAGADYRLIGKITSLSSFDTTTRMQSNLVQFSFEMLDLSNGVSIWGNLYDFKKAGANDKIYHE